MPVIGTLTVDLVANTATFTGDMGKVVNKLKELDEQGAKTGKGLDYSMTEARHGVMMLGEEFGVHLPRGITSFIASIGPVGAAMEAAFPFLAIAVGATLLIKHLMELREQAEKLELAQVNFGTAIEKVYGTLNDRLLEAGIKSDELEGNHLAALQKRLELIDHASLKELVAQFDVVSKSADIVLSEMKASWYQVGQGSVGATHALAQFKAQYDSLLAQSKDKEAGDLLAGTLSSAKKVIELQQQARQSLDSGNVNQENQALEARTKLKALGAGWSDKEAKSQEVIVDALNAQVEVEQKVAALKKAQDKDAQDTTDKKIGEEDDKGFREQAQEAKQAADQAEKAWDLAFKTAVDHLQQSEKEKIEATRQGTKERLEVINAAIKEEESKGLQETGFYRSLLSERVTLTRKMADDEAKITQEMASENLKQTLAMSRLQQDAEEREAQHRLAMHDATDKEVLAADLKALHNHTKNDIDAMNADIQALDKHDAQYLLRLQKFEHAKALLQAKADEEEKKLREKAQEKEFQDMQRALGRTADAVSSDIGRSLMESKSLAAGLENTGKQMVETALDNALKMILIGDMRQAKDAAHAAASAFHWVMADVPFPANAVIAPIAAGAAFAGVMAFEKGGSIPGSGPVPIIGHGGETVVTKALTDRVNASEGRGRGGRPVTITQNIIAKDADGFKKSQSQLHAQAFHAATKASKRNK